MATPPRHFGFLRATLLAGLLSSAIGAEPESEAASPGDGPGGGRGIRFGGLDWTGSLRQRYRFRRTAREEDQDTIGSFRLEARSPPSPGAPDTIPWSLHFQGSHSLDLDSFGAPPSPDAGFSPFTDVTNTFSRRYRGFVHSAYAEIGEVAFLERSRLGRQQIHRDTSLLFDGVHVRTKPWKSLRFELYGGVPAHLYEDSRSGDALAGLGIEARPLRSLVLAADHVYLRDENDLTRDATDHLTLIRGRYTLDREWTLRSSASWIGTRERRQSLALRYVAERGGLVASASFVRQNTQVAFQTSDLSPYLFLTGSYAPYHQLQLDLSRPIGERLEIGGGFDLRYLERSEDEGLYNREFRNLYASCDYRPWEGARLSVRGDFWDSEPDDIHSIGFELEQKFADLLRLRLGTNFALYRLDLLTGRERERDRIYYLKLRWKVLEGLELDTDYQYERDSFTEYHTVTAGLRLWF